MEDSSYTRFAGVVFTQYVGRQLTFENSSKFGTLIYIRVIVVIVMFRMVQILDQFFNWNRNLLWSSCLCFICCPVHKVIFPIQMIHVIIVSFTHRHVMFMRLPDLFPLFKSMEDILRCFIKDGQPDMNRQIEFIIKQLNSCKCKTTLTFLTPMRNYPLHFHNWFASPLCNIIPT